jgi:hypothetical protein
MRTASLFIRYANGLQAWPNDALAQVAFGAVVDERPIEIPARCHVETIIHPRTKDMVVFVANPAEMHRYGHDGDVHLYIPRGGSVVIEARDEGEDEMERARR